jgi:hypothetical protein
VDDDGDEHVGEGRNGEEQRVGGWQVIQAEG